MLDLKKEEYKARGEVVLEDIISRIKTKNKKRAALHLASLQTKLATTIGIGEENLTRMEMLQRQKQMLNMKVDIQDILKARRI